MGQGFNLHATQASRAGERVGLERLLRYILRPPVAAERLEQGPDGRMLMIAFVMAAEPIRKILRATGYPADSPRVYPARSFEELYELDPAA
jgi:hypothetical protein